VHKINYVRGQCEECPEVKSCLDYITVFVRRGLEKGETDLIRDDGLHDFKAHQKFVTIDLTTSALKHRILLTTVQSALLTTLAINGRPKACPVQRLVRSHLAKPSDPRRPA